MLRSIHELPSADMRVQCCSCQLRRCRRYVLQYLMIFVVVVLVTVLVSSLHRSPFSSSRREFVAAAAESLRRFVRSVKETADDDWAVPGDDGSSGYMDVSVNDSRLFDVKFQSYGDTVDLRLIVLAYDRPESLIVCLESLEMAEYAENDSVALHVWIDGPPADSAADEKKNDSRSRTIDVAQSFNFSHGSYRVHVRSQHVGVQGQWMTAWRPARPPGGSTSVAPEPEIALILEDDMSVSGFYWRWLRAAHRAYDHRADVSGYSVSHPEMEHVTGSVLEVPVNYTAFMYPVICTWAFSPHAASWRQFENWFFHVDSANSSFVPLVDGILPTDWFVSERRAGRERTLWEQWHIYYTWERSQYTVMANPGPGAGLLAVNRHEMGLHDGNVVVGATQSLCTDWTRRLASLPADIVQLGYDGIPVHPKDEFSSDNETNLFFERMH